MCLQSGGPAARYEELSRDLCLQHKEMEDVFFSP
jgi:hypothetical protein